MRPSGTSLPMSRTNSSNGTPVRAARPRRLGADVQDVDDAAPAPLLHLRPDQARESDGGEELQIEVLAPDLVRDLLEGQRSGRAGVVDQDIDLAEAVHDGVVAAPDV